MSFYFSPSSSLSVSGRVLPSLNQLLVPKPKVVTDHFPSTPSPPLRLSLLDDLKSQLSWPDSVCSSPWSSVFQLVPCSQGLIQPCTSYIWIVLLKSIRNNLNFFKLDKCLSHYLNGNSWDEVEIRLVRISFIGANSFWVSSRMSKGTNIAWVPELTNGRWEHRKDPVTTWAQPLVSHPWAGWKFCVPRNWTANLYAGYLCKISLTPTLNSCWKLKREAVSKSYCVQPYWLPVSRAVCQGASKREWEKTFMFWSRELGGKLWEQAGYPGKLCPRASSSIVVVFVTEHQQSPPKAQLLWTWSTAELCGCSLIWAMAWWLTKTLNFQGNFQQMKPWLQALNGLNAFPCRLMWLCKREFGSNTSFLGCQTGESRADFAERQRMCDELLVLLIWLRFFSL